MGYLTNFLEDETSYLRYSGQSDIERFYSVWGLSHAIPSSWSTWPTADQPEAKYKHASLNINLSPHLVKWSRSTYSSLDYLGDLGGLYGSLHFVVGIILAPLSSFTLNSHLFSTIHRVKPARDSKNNGDWNFEKNVQELLTAKHGVPRSYFAAKFIGRILCRSKETKRYR